MTGFFVVCWGGSLLIALLRTLPAALHPHNVTLPTAMTALITTALDTAAFRERGLSAIEYSRNA
ncbi:hypothetical protein B7L70_03350 [Vulcanisaeta sp. EB80]|uniref:hypothetical protein n=1 Tax=Vulcanisaeta sp. EB80 TaxID=1650660 RepID=UPI0009BDCB84|nr:hypothetical protein [Vulcanisaeta sp. EB80]PLC68414.1 hypothetical protein B7L70_03350 [Vulcanisaeta sp. EB80]